MRGLTGGERRRLWDLGSALRAVDIDEHDLDDERRRVLEASLDEHELAKVKLHITDRDARERTLRRLEEQLGGQLVEHLGHVAVLYRPCRDPARRRVRLPDLTR